MTAYHRPTTLREAVSILGGSPDLVIVSGATDIYPALTQRAAWGDRKRPDVLDISGIPTLSGIEDRGDHWWIGAATTWREIATAPLPPLFDGLKAAAREIGGVQVQSRGTIGGNIMTASPAGDSIPCLFALDAEIACAGEVEFRVPISAFITGYRKTALSAGEILTGVRVPKHAGRGYFSKLGARRYLVISIAMVAGLFEVDDDGCIRSAGIAVGACSAVAQRLPELEADIIGNRADRALVRRSHFSRLAPIDDVRASGAYRLEVVQALTADMIAGLSPQALTRGRAAS